MTPEEVEEIIKKTIAKIEADQKSFFVEPEKHYRSHDRLDRLLDAYDSAVGVVMKTLIGAMLLGLLVAAAMSMGFSLNIAQTE